MKNLLLTTLIVMGILWTIYVMATGDYREPREVVLERYH